MYRTKAFGKNEDPREGQAGSHLNYLDVAKHNANKLIKIKRIPLPPQIETKTVLSKYRKKGKKFEELHSTALLLPACCLQCEWCELCSKLSTIRGLHSHEHTGQS